MVQLAMLLTGIAVAVKATSWRQAVVITLIVFAVAVAVQTPMVGNEGGLDTAGDVVSYIVIQAVSLAIALGIARFGLHRRATRHAAA